MARPVRLRGSTASLEGFAAQLGQRVCFEGKVLWGSASAGDDIFLQQLTTAWRDSPWAALLCISAVLPSGRDLGWLAAWLALGP